MAEDRAREIVRALVDSFMRHQMGIPMDWPEPAIDLRALTLREMLDANDIVREVDRFKPGEQGKRSFQMVCDQRLVAASYVALHYPGADIRREKASTVAVVGGNAVLVITQASAVAVAAGGEDPEADE